MLRLLGVVAVFALAVPTLAAGQGMAERRLGARPGMEHPHPAGPVGRQFLYRGHMINRVRVAPFVYPAGWGYRRWVIGAVLPTIFLVPAYFFADWATLGLDPPDPGYQWVRYGPDLLLVDLNSGQVVDAVYGAFY